MISFPEYWFARPIYCLATFPPPSSGWSERNQISIYVADLPRKKLNPGTENVPRKRKTTEQKIKLARSFTNARPQRPLAKIRGITICRFNNNQMGKHMLLPKPPSSVHDHRPVAVQVVKQEKSGAVDKHVLVIDKPAQAGKMAPLPPPKKTP